MNTALKNWMSKASPPEQEDLAKRLGASRPYLYQISGGFSKVSAARAGELEEASRDMHRASKGRLPVLLRSELCSACAGCPYAKKPEA